MTDTAADEKARLRREALARRDALAADERAALEESLIRRLTALLREWPAASIAGYAAIGSEADVSPVLKALSGEGVATALPMQSGEGLMFLEWRPGDPLVAGRFGVSEPGPNAPVVIPQVLIVPMVGFDRNGHRLGYGKGHYDRAIAALAADGDAPRLVGAAFAVQEVEAIPVEPHDAVLDMIVTENETIVFAAG